MEERVRDLLGMAGGVYLAAGAYAVWRALQINEAAGAWAGVAAASGLLYGAFTRGSIGGDAPKGDKCS